MYCPGPEDYHRFIENEWADIHHSRIQEWSALGVITGVHIGIIQILNFFHELLPKTFPIATLAVIGCIMGFLFAILGGLMTCRHRRLMWIKLNWIYDAEEKLGLIKTEKNPSGIIPEISKMAKKPEWNRLMWPRFLSTSWLILAFYFLLTIFDLMSLVVFSFIL